MAIFVITSYNDTFLELRKFGTVRLWCRVLLRRVKRTTTETKENIWPYGTCPWICIGTSPFKLIVILLYYCQAVFMKLRKWNHALKYEQSLCFVSFWRLLASLDLVISVKIRYVINGQLIDKLIIDRYLSAIITSKRQRFTQNHKFFVFCYSSFVFSSLCLAPMQIRQQLLDSIIYIVVCI